MAKIYIKNFGPIKEGYQENKGFMEITPVTVICGNQATGKSTIAKIYSTFAWLEKENSRFNMDSDYNTMSSFYELCKNQKIEEYIKPNTKIKYIGDLFSFSYENSMLKKTNNHSSLQKYNRPQIMYVPAERNLLTTIEDAENIKRLPLMLSIFLEEYNNARKNSKTGDFKIPVSDVSIKYDKESLSTFVITKDRAIVSIYNSSSGIQSVVPLSIVTRYLTKESQFDLKRDVKKLSSNEKKQLQQLINSTMNNNDNNIAEEIVDAIIYGRKYDEEIFNKLKKATHGFFNSCFINIVEEPEQNLYPSSQAKVLFELLECMNNNEFNQLILTTHSLYILVYLTLVAKASELINKKVPSEKIEQIVPKKSIIDGNKISIYETQEDGTIKKLKPYENLPSDLSLLNQAMAKGNELFAQLIDLEQEYCL